MRLGQLARKLERKSSEIVEFLASKNIQIDDGVNTKVDANHEALIFQHFSPNTPPESFRELETLATEAPVDDLIAGVNEPQESPQDIQEPTSLASTDELQPERNDVIKAAKVELSGLKVLGKIDLPEPKKKSTEPLQENPPEASPENAEGERPKEFKRENRNPNYKKQQRSAKNPIALQREQEALAANKKREEELKLQKERRTQNYLKKVKSHQPTKAARLIKEEAEEMSAAELAESPKTWWGKFVKWFTN